MLFCVVVSGFVMVRRCCVVLWIRRCCRVLFWFVVYLWVCFWLLVGVGWMVCVGFWGWWGLGWLDWIIWMFVGCLVVYVWGLGLVEGVVFCCFGIYVFWYGVWVDYFYLVKGCLVWCLLEDVVVLIGKKEMWYL